MHKGQIVYLKPGVNRSRGGIEIKEGVVKSIGRKYITVGIGEWNEYKFHKDTLKEVMDCSPSYYLYETKQQILDEAEYSQLSQFMRKTFDYYGTGALSLEQLRQIKAIIEGGAKC